MKQVGEEQKEAETAAVSPRPSHEGLFGTVLFVTIMASILLVVGGIFWMGYRGFQLNQKQSALPSIGSLSVREGSETATDPTQEVTKEPTPEPGEKATPSDEKVLSQAKNTEVKVLNGGAAKGSAATGAELLTKGGYTKVTTGNTVSNYTGVTVYYAAGLEEQAGIVREALLKTYPKAEIKPALKDNKETSQGAITVILGK